MEGFYLMGKTKKFITLLLAAVMLTILLPQGVAHVSAAGGTWSGSGTSSDPWLIEDAEDLALININMLGNAHPDTADPYGDFYTTYTGCYFLLTSDIYLYPYLFGLYGQDLYTTSPGWQPIGSNGGDGFRGIFDGAGYTVTGLYINGPTYHWVGLFGDLGMGGVVKNLNVAGGPGTGVTGAGNFSNPVSGVGGVVGYNNGGTVENCSNACDIIGSTFPTGYDYLTDTYSGYDVEYNLGGVVGNNDGTVVNCYNTGTVTGSITPTNNITFTSTATLTDTGVGSVGGVVGKNGDSSGGNGTGQSISDCYNTGTVTGGGSTGGIVGESNGLGGLGHVSFCYNTGAVTVTGDSNVGGVVGDSAGASVTSCYNVGAVTGNGSGDVGGVTGHSQSSMIDSCYNTGIVTGKVTGAGNVGGVAGDCEGSGVVNLCYNAGAVAGPASPAGNTGSIVGYNNVATITDCYYSKSVNPSTLPVCTSTTATVYNMVDLTTAQMTADAVGGTMANFNAAFNAA